MIAELYQDADEITALNEVKSRVDGINSYTCNCAKYFDGKNCQNSKIGNVYLLVPTGNNSPGHEHTANEQPNKIDPAGGWTNTGETYQEGNGIKRRLWTKPLVDGMKLYHTVNLGWGYLYFVAGTSMSITDNTNSAACGPNLIKNANANTNSNCDRDYKVGSSGFFSKYGTMSLIQDAHDPNDHHWPVNTKFVTVHA